MYTTILIRSWEELQSISQEWDELFDGSHSDCIFLTWEWIDAWRRAVGNSIETYVVTVRGEDERLVGIAPFYNATMKIARAVPLRVLRILGDYSTGAAYSNWITCREDSDQVYGVIAAFLRQQRDWDCIWMPYVASWTGAQRKICDASSKNDIYVNARPVFFSAVPLPKSFDEYLRTLSRSGRRELKRAIRRIASGHDHKFLLCGQQDAIGPLLNRLFELNSKRWAAAGERGVFDRKPAEARFYREFAPVALARGWLRLLALKDDQGVFAVEIGYAYKGKFYSLQAGFDPDGPRNAGRALIGKLLETLMAEGVQEVDYLCGQAGYKTRLGAKPREGHDILLAQRSIRTALLRMLRIWPRGRYVEFVEPC